MNILKFLDESRIEISAQALGNAEGAFLIAVIIWLSEMKQFVEDTSGRLLSLSKVRWRKHTDNLELKAINELLSSYSLQSLKKAKDTIFPDQKLST